MAELMGKTISHKGTGSCKTEERMAELKRDDDGRPFVELELYGIDLYIVTHSLALYLDQMGTVKPLAGSLKRIANTYYRALKESGFTISEDDIKFWTRVGICPPPESDPAVLIF